MSCVVLLNALYGHLLAIRVHFSSTVRMEHLWVLKYVTKLEAFFFFCIRCRILEGMYRFKKLIQWVTCTAEVNECFITDSVRIHHLLAELFQWSVIRGISPLLGTRDRLPCALEYSLYGIKNQRQIYTFLMGFLLSYGTITWDVR